MEKTRLVVVHKMETEDAVTCSAYICVLEKMRVKCILLDEIMTNPSSLSVRSHIIVEDTCLLKQLRELMDKATIADVVQFVEDNDSNTILWYALPREKSQRQRSVPLGVSRLAMPIYRNLTRFAAGERWLSST